MGYMPVNKCDEDDVLNKHCLQCGNKWTSYDIDNTSITIATQFDQIARATRDRTRISVTYEMFRFDQRIFVNVKMYNSVKQVAGYVTFH